MARGTRAIHGAEVTGHHHASGQTDLEMIQAEYDYLPTLCHCQRMVVIAPQRIVRRGATLSCGAGGCRHPGADPARPVLVGHAIPVSGAYAEGYSVDQAVKRFGSALRIRRDVVRERARVSRRKGTSRQATADRRESVRLLHEMGHRNEAIAQRLLVNAHTIASDLAWLRARGRVAPGQHGGSRGNTRRGVGSVGRRRTSD